jgi:hypothetical protein
MGLDARLEPNHWFFLTGTGMPAADWVVGTGMACAADAAGTGVPWAGTGVP